MKLSYFVPPLQCDTMPANPSAVWDTYGHVKGVIEEKGQEPFGNIDITVGSRPMPTMVKPVFTQVMPLVVPYDIENYYRARTVMAGFSR